MVLVGCLVSPVSGTGGIGSNTVVNTISFDKRAGGFGNMMWGSYGNPQTIRVRVSMLPIPGTANIRLVPKLYSVSSAGESGFEDQRPLMGLWNGEFGPIFKKISAQAGGAGPGY